MAVSGIDFLILWMNLAALMWIFSMIDIDVAEQLPQIKIPYNTDGKMVNSDDFGLSFDTFF